jgi:hypothetical protein
MLSSPDDEEDMLEGWFPRDTMVYAGMIHHLLAAGVEEEKFDEGRR